MYLSNIIFGFLGGSVVKNQPANAGDKVSIPGSGRSLGGGNGTPLQYSCLENSMDREDQRNTIHAVSKHQTQLSTCEHSVLLKEKTPTLPGYYG